MKEIFKRLGGSLAAVVMMLALPMQIRAQEIAYGADVG